MPVQYYYRVFPMNFTVGFPASQPKWTVCCGCHLTFFSCFILEQKLAADKPILGHRSCVIMSWIHFLAYEASEPGFSLYICQQTFCCCLDHSVLFLSVVMFSVVCNSHVKSGCVYIPGWKIISITCYNVQAGMLKRTYTEYIHLVKRSTSKIFV